MQETCLCTRIHNLAFLNKFPRTNYRPRWLKQPFKQWLAKGASIMPSQPVRNQREYPRKMERRTNREEWFLPFLTAFPNSLIRAKNRFVKNGTANFGRNIPTEISGPPAEVIPNMPVGRNRNGRLHLNSNRNFRYLWHNGNNVEMIK